MYYKGKWCTAGGKDPLFGHVDGFQIDSPEMVHAICSHGCGLCCDVEPTHKMEKILFCRRRADRPDRRSRPDAPQQERHGHGGQQSEKEIQDKEFRRRMLP